ncbi:MAG: small multi-drug export protein [Spirochaetia bacterium]|nr:small multi-drug export protein [Spirochaetia bacterium]MCF7946623.1 small multi-drug export protein [Spirochaetia bacterium]MCF7952699.1 small multi-drug export protein [Spirochaetales bacterium]
MELHVLLKMLFLSVLPISELRGAIPYAYFKGVPLFEAYLICVAANALVAPLVYIFLSSAHHLFYKMGWYRTLFHKTVERARMKIETKVRKYEYLGVMLFVAIPLPITGAYTGTLGAWVLGLGKKRTILAAFAGVIISGTIVSLVLLFGIEVLSIFIKDV